MCRSLSSHSWLRVPSRLANRLAFEDKHGGEEVAMATRECKENRVYQTNVEMSPSPCLVFCQRMLSQHFKHLSAVLATKQQ